MEIITIIILFLFCTLLLAAELFILPGTGVAGIISQLKQAGKEDKYYDVLAEIPQVRKDFGYPPRHS